MRAGGNNGGGDSMRDNGRGICAGKTGVVRWNNGWVGGTGGSRTAPTGENVVGYESHPHPPVFTRAGSNLPPSWRKGFVGAERAVFIVMTFGEGGMGPRIREDTRGEGVC